MDSSVLQSNVRSFYIPNDCTVNYPLSLVLDVQVCGIWEQLWCRNPGILVWTSGVSFRSWPRKTCRMSLKLGGFLKPFKGVRGDDLASFWKKFEVLCVAEKWDSDDDKMARLPLLLDGAAFVVVDQMSDGDRKDPKKVKAALETAFAPSAAEAYHLFVGRHLPLDETVDIFVADLQRLLKLSKHTLAADGKDPVLIEQFLSGLPAEFSRTLRLEHAAKSHSPGAGDQGYSNSPSVTRFHQVVHGRWFSLTHWSWAPLAAVAITVSWYASTPLPSGLKWISSSRICSGY